MTEFLNNIGYGNWVIEALLIIPLLAGGALFFAPEKDAKKFALVAALVEFVVSVQLWWVFEIGTPAMQFQH